MKSYQYIEKFINGAKLNSNYFHGASVSASFDAFLNNWCVNYNCRNIENIKILVDFEEDVVCGLYTKTYSHGKWVHFYFTEAGKDFIRFKEML